MKASKFLFILVSSVLLAACSGGGDNGATTNNATAPIGGGGAPGGGGPAPKTLSGQFINCPTWGLEYEIVETGETGVTDLNGNFAYPEGSTVRFFIGKLELGSALAGDILQPKDLQPSENGKNNIARFLETLDEDRNCDNGIRITDAVLTAANDPAQPVVSATDFDVDAATFEGANYPPAKFAREANGGQRTLVSAMKAAQELACAEEDAEDGKYDGVCNVWFIQDNNDPAPAPNDDQTQEELDALTAMFAAQPGDVIQFGPGTFEFTKGLTMSNREDVTIRGVGYKDTILDFFESLDANGILLENIVGATIEDLTVIDTPGDSIKISSSDYVEITNVRAMWSSKASELGPRGGMDPTVPSTLDLTCEHAWPDDFERPDDVMPPINAHSPEGGTGAYPEASGFFLVGNTPTPYQVDPSNGAYALYPVKSNDVLMTNVIAIGASDAGIYVGQSNDIIIKESEALFNVAGYEIENSDRADMFDNVAHCNTAGFLVFDLPDLNQYGEQTRVFRNYAGYNNQENFKGGGGIVSVVPKGIGLLQLGYDRVEFFQNVIEWNRTLGFVAASHQLLDGTGPNATSDKKMDLQPEGIYIHHNTFRWNGDALPPPRQSDPQKTDSELQEESLLPALVAAKGSDPNRTRGDTPEEIAANPDAGNEGKGAHIVWDGYMDHEPFPCGQASVKPSRGFDEDGKPDYALNDTPPCRYNAYKFETGPDGEFLKDADDNFIRKDPKYWMCFDDTNIFENGRVFINFNGREPTDPASVDPTKHDCPAEFGAQLPRLPEAVVEKYVAGIAGDPPPTAAEIAEICEGHDGAGINRDALPYNCKKLSHYNLFEDSTDPRQGFVDNGMLYDLSTALFSDYASKYRVLYLPPGQKAQWVEGSETNPNGTLLFPEGTVIAKTFSFKHRLDGEKIIETRLLIHRRNRIGDGTVWEGLPYVWREDMSDADLFVAGTTRQAFWNYDDPDEDVEATYVGSTNYSVPSANQCGLCHNNDDNEAGDAPIGPKVRYLNMAVWDGVRDVNQLQLMIDRGVLEAPSKSLDIREDGIAHGALRVPRFNVATDDGNIPIADNAEEQARFAAMNADDQRTEQQARAWLEVNCGHCHNDKGGAASTGLLLNVFRPVDKNHGICKTPTTSGSKGGGAEHLIMPGAAFDSEGKAKSVVAYRIHAHERADERMPPLARSVKQDEAAALIDHWIDNVVDSSYADAGCESVAE